MSTVNRHILISIGFSLVTFTLIMLVIFWIFPLGNWSELWHRKIFDLPFILFVPSLSIGLGIIFGLALGLHSQKYLKSIEVGLSEIEQGKSMDLNEEPFSQEYELIWSRMKMVQKQLIEQTKRSQKLATEKAVDQEKRIQEIVSQERNRLARELHDSVSQQLFAASMMMSAINETKPISDDRETKQLKMVEEMIHQSQLEMRALLLHLRPVALKGKTLEEGIKELLMELSQKVPMKITWKIEAFQLDKGVEDHLFRILQESISNTLRHAKASELEILLIQRDGFTILRVVDNGIGFDGEESKAGSYGLENMYERAAEVGGTLKMVSLKNKGTRLEVKVPIIADEGESND